MVADTVMVDSKFFNSEGKYLPESERAAVWLDAARARMQTNGASFSGGSLRNSISSGIEKGEFTQDDLYRMVKSNSDLWDTYAIHVVVFHVFVFNQRSWPLRNIELDVDETVAPGHTLEIISELVNQFNAIESIKLTKPNRDKNTEVAILFPGHPAKKYNPDEFKTLFEEQKQERKVNRPNRINEVKQVYSLDALLDCFKNDKSQIEFKEVKFRMKAIRSDIKRMVYEKSEKFLDDNLPINGTKTRNAERHAIQKRIMNYLSELDIVCFDMFGRNLLQIPTQEQETLFNLALQNVPMVKEILAAQGIAPIEI
jgi:hypothetical protein